MGPFLENPNDPFIDAELSIKIGAAFSQKLKILGLGEELKINALAIDYMNFKWASNARGIKYTPYKGIESSFNIGGAFIYGGAKMDWYNMKFIPIGQYGVLSKEWGQAPRLNIIDIGSMFGVGYDFKVTVSPGKLINSQVKYQSSWFNRLRFPVQSFTH